MAAEAVTPCDSCGRCAQSAAWSVEFEVTLCDPCYDHVLSVEQRLRESRATAAIRESERHALTR